MPRFKRKIIEPIITPIIAPDIVEEVTKKAKGLSKKKNGNGNGSNGNGKSNLTAKQARFVNEYLIDLNALQASIRAGYSKNSAAIIGHQNLRKLNVMQAIDKRKAELAKKVEINQEWIVERYKRLTEYNADDLYDEEGNLKPLSQIPKNALYAIHGFKNMNTRTTTKTKAGTEKESVTILSDVKMPDKRMTLDSLGKFLGLSADKPDALGNTNNFSGPVQINVEITHDD